MASVCRTKLSVQVKSGLGNLCVNVVPHKGCVQGRLLNASRYRRWASWSTSSTSWNTTFCSLTIAQATTSCMENVGRAIFGCDTSWKANQWGKLASEHVAHFFWRSAKTSERTREKRPMQTLIYARQSLSYYSRYISTDETTPGFSTHLLNKHSPERLTIGHSQARLKYSPSNRSFSSLTTCSFARCVRLPWEPWALTKFQFCVGNRRMKSLPTKKPGSP